MHKPLLSKLIRNLNNTVKLYFFVTPFLFSSAAIEANQQADEPKPKPGSVFKDCSDCPELTVIPSGHYIMGTLVKGPGRAAEEVAEHPAERELSLIHIRRSFAIGTYEVTKKEFFAYVDEQNPDVRSDCRSWDSQAVSFADMGMTGWQNINFPKDYDDRHPMICVDWHDAKAYANWLSDKTGQTYRLPSEAEWEYAAKAGTQTLRFWGDEPFDGCDYANTFDQTGANTYPLSWPTAPCHDGYADLSPVGSYQPNAFGLYDMIGNVWEWNEDCSSRSYIGRPKDERAWVWQGCKRVIQRGGSWITAPSRSRSAYHGDGRPTDRAVFFGFRLVREIPQ